MTDATTVENDIAGRIAIVEGRRAEGQSVTAACRAAGISTSTYYRRRRAGCAPSTAAGGAEAVGAVVLVSQQSGPNWPFADATPHAPLFWDQAFSSELTDSFVRRAFGAVGGKSRPVRPVAVMAIPANPLATHLMRRAQRLWRRLGAGPLGVVIAPLAAVALIALLVFTAGWMVSVAADPAAWLSHPTPTEVATASGPLSR